MSKFLKNPAHKAQIGYNGFDLSKNVKFTCGCGQLLPVFWTYSSPGDKFKLNSQLFVRTQPLQTSSFVRARAHVEWFHVPLRYLYSIFGDFFYNINDVTTSLFTNLVTDNVQPTINIPCITQQSLNEYIFGPTVVPILGTVSLSRDQSGIPLASNYARLIDLIGISPLKITASKTVEGAGSNIRYSLLPFAAYQKIFYDYYRISRFTPNNTRAYNLDDLYMSDPNTIQRLKPIFELHYRPFARDFFSNIFPNPLYNNESGESNGILPNNNLIFAPLGDENFGVPSQSQSTQAIAIPSSNTAHNTLPASLTAIYNSANINASAVSPASLRAMFAKEKMDRITMMAGRHYDAQTLAHFGVSVPDGLSNEVSFIGGQVTPIVINEVVGTATTEESVLGQVAGKGFGSTASSRDLSFTCREHGILMAIYSIEPIANYDSSIIDRKLYYRTPLDFYHPEYDSLGMQPLYLSQYFANASPNEKTIVGWQYRYAELKSSFDTVHGAFNHAYGGTLVDWSAVRNYLPDDGADQPIITYDNFVDQMYISPSYFDNIFLRAFTNLQKGSDIMDYSNESNPSRFLTVSAFFEGDNFLNDLDLKIYKSSKMSVYGLPNM